MKKCFTLAEALITSLIVIIISASVASSYNLYIKSSVEAMLKNAVMVNVSIVEAFYQTNGFWPTDVDPENPNLTTDEELQKFGLAARNLSKNFMMRVFKKDGYPNIIAREQIGSHKYGVIVNYHFKKRQLEISYE